MDMMWGVVAGVQGGRLAGVEGGGRDSVSESVNRCDRESVVSQWNEII